MSPRRFIIAAVLSVAILGMFSRAQAALVTEPLGDSGWSVRYDNVGLTLTLLNPPADVEDTAFVVLEKVAQFGEGLNEFGFFDPLEISFIQTGEQATQYVVIDVEHVFNDTGIDWSGFRFIVEDPMQGVGGGAHFDQALSADFDITPFTTKTYNGNSTELFVSGGTVPHTPPGDEWLPGFDHGSLFINANPFDSGNVRRTFVFKEQPVSVIPLPAAAWTGLSGLLGLGMIGVAKNWRRFLSA
jgi:hypothetical protein